MFVVQRPKPGIGNGPITLDLSEGALQNLYLAAPPPTPVAYTIRMLKGAALWEVGTGQLSVGGSLVRTTVTSNSSGNTTPIDFGSNPVEVTILRIVTAGGSIAPTVQLGTGSNSGTVPAGATRVRINGTAAGGNGGGTGASGGGGASGEHVVDLVLPVTAGAAWSLSVGAVGANTTFTIGGVVYTLRPGANGSNSGPGGNGGGSSTAPAFGLGGVDGGQDALLGYDAGSWRGGIGGGAANGGGGGKVPPGPNAGAASTSGAGAGSPWGKGGDGRGTSGAGNAATGYGAGGGGGQTGGAGGAGAPGFLLLEWQ